MSYRKLDPQRVIATIARLSQRIDERFPYSGLAAVARELLQTAREAQGRAEAIARPKRFMRIVVFVGVVALLAAFVFGLYRSTFSLSVGGLEAAANLIVLVGGAVFFLVTVERRVGRKQALRAMHELRVLAHVVDMHQLTKDPQRVVDRDRWLNTASSPEAELTPFQLFRYLDYCAEMVSLIGKVATVYVQHFDDDAAIASANEVESLTTGLSRKVWQKIMVLQELRKSRGDLKD